MAKATKQVDTDTVNDTPSDDAPEAAAGRRGARGKGPGGARITPLNTQEKIERLIMQARQLAQEGNILAAYGDAREALRLAQGLYSPIRREVFSAFCEPIVKGFEARFQAPAQ